MPETRGGGGLALVDRKLHYMGGVKSDSDTDAEDHWVLDLDKWAKGAPDGTPLPHFPPLAISSHRLRSMGRSIGWCITEQSNALRRSFGTACVTPKRYADANRNSDAIE
ncbi:MAG: hypothetical protein CMJ64_18435 [Planctomycetaceae bacterium]|nr:hypothetical protein [Planctomycetaceae bacterium]